MRKNLSLEIIKAERKKSRIEKISSLIKRTLSEIFLTQDFNDVDGKDVLIFVSNVVLSGDGKSARVFVEKLQSDLDIKESKILEIIENNSAKIKKEFANKIELRFTPKLRFQLASSQKIKI